ncbi:hypothetical protein ACFQE8_21985 [Salinirubellus sp. GCM10025818]|uniref:hypothetical protein n=1 Tax=Salinirubellus TaxID=2162630 RepID=UPI0030D55237
MNTITGKVESKEQHDGIPDVLVVAYDMGVDGTVDDRGEDVDLEEERAEDLWNVLAGQGASRLGSVLTDSGGLFELRYDEDRERGRDNSRADLVLFILGPETTQEADEVESREDGRFPTATPLSRQILHHSHITRVEAGETESYLIQLSQKQLETAGISLLQRDIESFEPAIEANRHLAAIDKASEFNQTVKDGLVDRGLIEEPQTRVDRSRKNLETIRKQTRRFTTVPKSQRTSEYFVSDSDGETARATAITKARQTGSETLERYRERQTERNPLVTTVSSETADQFGFELPESGGPPTQIQQSEEVFCSLLRPSEKGYDLTRVRSLLEQGLIPDEEDIAETKTTITFEGEPSGSYSFTVNGSLAKSNAMGAWNNADDTIAESATDEWTASGSVDGRSGRDSYEYTGEVLDIDVDPEVSVYIDGEATVLADGDNLETELRQRVLGQLTDLARFDASDGRAADTLAQLRDSIDQLQLSGGPANVTSIHDFHALQFAFPGVWTEAFDDSVKGNVEKLYDTHVQLHEEYGVTLPSFVEIEEIVDINAFLKEVERESEILLEPVPEDVSGFWEEATFETWNLLSKGQQEELIRLSNAGLWEASRDDIPEVMAFRIRDSVWKPEGLQEEVATGMGTTKVRYEKGLKILANPAGARTRLTRLLKEIRERLSEPYSFHYFEPNSVNYGILTTYRQEWQPGPYQVADLVSTIPLAPGETRKYTKKETVKRSRAEKEVEKALSTQRGESAVTDRAESEIIRKATEDTKFKLSASGWFSSTAEFAMNQASESAQTKKNFREAVVKASHEYKNERNLEVSTTEAFTGETTTSGELSNPNNELTVTYLLYELERQYRISERIHRVTPVVFVAQDIPAPHEITEAWLLEHEWVLRRVLLDDSFHGALDDLHDSFAGDELSVNIKEQNWKTQRELIESLQETLDSQKGIRKGLRERLIGSRSALVKAQTEEDSEGWAQDFWEDTYAGDDEEHDIGNAEAKVEALEMELEYLEASVQEMEGRLQSERGAFNEGTRAYTDALEERSNRRTAIDQLRMHVKENILYYMQAIWDYEPPDQRYFRLYHREVYVPRAGTVTLTLRKADENESTGLLGLKRFVDVDGDRYVVEVESSPIPVDDAEENTARLIEIADLDNPIGYKGNYIAFPLKTCTFLTDYMMNEYVDDYFGIRDPDDLAEFTSEELRQFVELKHNELVNDESLTEQERQTEIDALEASIGEIIRKRLANPRRETDLVVVPTGQLYMEAILGEKELLEGFKLAHRGYDAAKARAELRQEELENLRYAARLLDEDPDFGDPDVDRHVIVEGIDSTAVISADKDDDENE